VEEDDDERCEDDDDEDRLDVSSKGNVSVARTEIDQNSQ